MSNVISQWDKCYPSNWKGLIVPESMSHPAKYSSKLIRRIYAHLAEEGWIEPGDSVIDPFGGVALGALEAMRMGLCWTGIELELKFIELGGMTYECPGFSKEWWKRYYSRPAYIQKLRKQFALCPCCESALMPKRKINKKDGKLQASEIPNQPAHTYRGNIALWKKMFGNLPNFGSAQLLQGDSRKLLEVLKAGLVDMSLSSPPYTGNVAVEKNSQSINLEKQYEHYKASGGGQSFEAFCKTQLFHSQGYGASDGQLGSMKSDGFDAAISSPPFEQRSADGGWQMFGRYAEEGKLTVKQVKGDSHKSYPSWDKERDTSYGNTEGQMSKMKSDNFDLSISSPPFEKGSEGVMRADKFKDPEAFARMQMNKGNGSSFEAKMRAMQKDNERAEYGNSAGQLGQMKSGGFELSISSPPFLQSEGGTPDPKPGGPIDKALYARHAAGNAHANGYGNTDGQLSSMRDGGFDVSIASPPFTDQTKNDDRAHGGLKQHDQGGEIHKHYGDAAGQLAGMPAEGFDTAISSPPYEDSVNQADSANNADRRLQRKAMANIDLSNAANRGGPNSVLNKPQVYGETCGQLGADSGDDFWLAARLIVEQVYLALRPGGHAVWVVKDYVKNKKIVPFCDQWSQLCEVVGFITLHEHHAMLVHHKGTQHTLEGGTVEHKTESKSFFRRLAEKRAAERNYWKSLTQATQEKWLEKASAEQWDWYNGLTDAEKSQRESDGTLKNEKPSKASILAQALSDAFADSGEKYSTWNRDTSIDYETVFCMVKPMEFHS